MMRDFVNSLMGRLPSRLSALVIAAATAAACETDEPFQPPPQTTTPVASVHVTEPAGELQPGDTVRLTATPRAADGRVLSGRPVSWTSSDTAVAAVIDGLVTARGDGAAFITAQAETRSASVRVWVETPQTPPPPPPGQVMSLQIVAPSATLHTGTWVQYRAVLRNAIGDSIAAPTPLWSTDDAAVATVSPIGVVRAWTPGTTTVRATAGNLTATATLVVTQAPPPPPPPVMYVFVAPYDPAVFVGDEVQLEVSTIPATTGRAVTWTSSNPAVATVSTTGRVRGIAKGIAYVKAEIEGKSSVATVQVRNKPTGPVHEYKLYGIEGGPLAVGYDPTSWVDSTGAVIPAHQMVNTARLRLQLDVYPMRYEHTVTMDLYRSGVSPTVKLGQRTFVDRGEVWYNVFTGAYILQSTTSPGLVIHTRFGRPGEIVLPQSIAGSPIVPWIYLVQS